MDAYQVYLNTLRHVMNADPNDTATWGDIFKYLPCLHQMLLCSVCGNLLNCPQGPVNSVCLHNICHGCLGGKMRLKPSCSWCKDHSNFTENKKLRILVLCFKRLCAYISHSDLGSEILKYSTNGLGKDPEITLQVLKDVDQFVDDFPFTAPLIGLPKSLKPSFYGLKFSNSKPSTSGTTEAKVEDYQFDSERRQKLTGGNRGSGKRRTNPSNTSISIHIKRLKRKALSLSSSRNNVSTKKFQLQKLPNSVRFMKRNSPSNSSGLLISQRPHRELSGKFSVGQLWRETFQEEKSQDPEVYYPDSGIEVGNASDQDHGSQLPVLKHQIEPKKSSSNSKIENHERMIHHVRDTRLHPTTESVGINAETKITENHKPRLTLTISKMQLSKASKNVRPKSSSSESTDQLPSKYSNYKRRGELKVSTDRSSLSLSRRRDICRCARFKKPNQLTCFGQKCPCYRDRKACVDCLCNGCKNPRRKSDPVPSLLHVLSESSCIQHGLEPSMPRLSPIPRI